MLEERLKALFGVKKQMKVGDYSSPATQTVSTGDLLIDISEKMEKNKIRHLPVFEGENLVGIVSHSTVQLLAGFQQELSLTAKEIMTRDPYVINFDTHLHDVLKYMMDKKISSAIVKSADGKYSIFTTFDALHVLFNVTV